ncbi:unnamed protein product [Coffea canephora]|uniref:Uncharacterized protein n=1 Tax=Coffea canephora TaxID=49390 RepID=A0A068TNY6_COFCA|nr:unnamed protein product [Coffea canephora]
MRLVARKRGNKFGKIFVVNRELFVLKLPVLDLNYLNLVTYTHKLRSLGCMQMTGLSGWLYNSLQESCSLENMQRKIILELCVV